MAKTTRATSTSVIRMWATYGPSGVGSGEAAVEGAGDLRFNTVRERGSPIARSGTSRTASDRWQVADVFRPLVGRTSGRRSGCRRSRRLTGVDASALIGCFRLTKAHLTPSAWAYIRSNPRVGQLLTRA